MWNVCFVGWVCLGFTLVNTTNILETDVECLFCAIGLSGFYFGEYY
jgi:hypothetical protein